jgi:hypothetical protein
MNELIDVLPELAAFDHFATGSRVYGGFNEKSDWDWVFRMNDYNAVEAFLKSKGYTIKLSSGYDDNCSMKFNLSPDPEKFKGVGILNLCCFNFIFQDDNLFDAWKFATEEIIHLIPKHPNPPSSHLHLKSIRVTLFQSLVGFHWSNCNGGF